MITSAFERVNEGLSEATNFIIQETANERSDANFINADSYELFRMLVTKELNQLDPKQAKKKRKQLLQLVILYDDSDSE